MTDLQTEVERFKAWASKQVERFGEWEMYYDSWTSLLAAAKETLVRTPLEDVDIGRLLYVLARDNEGEFLREMLEDHPSNGLAIARVALDYPDPDARWQVADFLGTQNSSEAKRLLRKLLDDANEYVRRRALSAASRHDRHFAERTAWEWILSVDDYTRLAALTVLHDLSSPRLDAALDQLRDDGFIHVRSTVSKIEAEREIGGASHS